MDRWDKSQRQDRYRRERDNPSFSSTLLDSIYRSIDEGNCEGEEELIFYRETMRKKHGGGGGVSKEDEMASLRRACMVEKWMMEKKVSEKVVVRRKCAADFDRKSRCDRDAHGLYLNSSSSSSESSCGGGFSSSEAESVYGVNSRSSNFAMQRPKPVRTSVSVQRPEKPRSEFNMVEDGYHHHHHHHQQKNYAQLPKPKNEGRFVKTKSRALKIYGDLKKVKQPISPGGRLASFLNSLFTTGHAKKAKISSSSSVGGYADTDRKSNSVHGSTCSSASSFSRSCLSKTPSSSGGTKSSNGAKRSVTFFPASVIVGEDCRPCGYKSLHEDDGCKSTNFMAVTSIVNPTNEELKFHVMKEARQVEQDVRALLKSYQKNSDFNMKDLRNKKEEFENDDDEDDDDAASCASSDLFELDNLGATGIDRYSEELPVYETTHVDTNRAIANGLIM